MYVLSIRGLAHIPGCISKWSALRLMRLYSAVRWHSRCAQADEEEEKSLLEHNVPGMQSTSQNSTASTEQQTQC